MAEGSRDLSDSQAAPPAANAAADEGYLAARAQFAARRSYKRALRRARNPLYFSLRSLVLLVALVMAASAMTLILVFAMRREPTSTRLAPVIQVVDSSMVSGAAELLTAPEATSVPEVQVIMAAETPQSLMLEGPAIPTVIITNTPVPLRVGLQAAVYGVGNDKLNIRNSPSLTESQVLFREDAGKRIEIIGGPHEADGFTWWQVRDPQFQVQGWAVARYLRAVAEDTGN